MSYFDEGTEPRRTTTRSPRPRQPKGGRGRTPQADEQALLIRRAVAVGVGLLVVILLVLFVKHLINNQRTNALRSYNNSVSQIATESAQLSPLLFQALQGAAGMQAIQVESEIDRYSGEATQQAASAAALSVPSQMAGAQRNVLLALDLRAEGVQKIASNLGSALGGADANAAITTIAGDMEMLLASDVIYSVRVVPLIEQTLASQGVGGQVVTSSRFLTNLSWLNTGAVTQALLGHPLAGSPTASFQPGRHGHALLGVSVGSETLTSSSPNYITRSSGTTFTLQVQNQGQFNEFGVGVQVEIEGTGTSIVKKSTIATTVAGGTTQAMIPLGTSAPPKNTPLRLTATVEHVPGEVNLTNNTEHFTVIFQ